MDISLFCCGRKVGCCGCTGAAPCASVCSCGAAVTGVVGRSCGWKLVFPFRKLGMVGLTVVSAACAAGAAAFGCAGFFSVSNAELVAAESSIPVAMTVILH